MLHSKCSAINQLTECVYFSLSSTFGALQLLPHGCCHRLILFFLNSSASCIVFFFVCFVFYPPVLIFLPSPLACSFCLSAGDVCSARQWAFTWVPCLLLRGPLCSSAASLIPLVNAHSRDTVCLSGFLFFLNHFLVKVFGLCFLHLFHTEPLLFSKNLKRDVTVSKMKSGKCSFIPKQNKIRR